jgi:tetratricopeptide (TPR) repeat protein
MPDLTDRHGLALTTRSPIAVERYVQGMDRQLSLNAGGVEGLASAVDADPAFALGHAGLAFAQWYRSDIPSARASLQRAQALIENTSPRERQHIQLVGTFIGGEGAQALPLMHEHLTAYPRDALVIQLATMTIAGSGRLTRPREQYELLSRLAPAWVDDWWFQGVYAFTHHEMNLLDDARRLAERSLEQQPRNAAGAHPLAHVFFESNEHAGGAGFLADWITEYDRAAPFFCHLSWHLALFELARGNVQRVLDLYDNAISPSVGSARTTLVDSASLLWRYQLYGCQPRRDLPWADVCSYVSKAAPTPGMAFLDAHAALAFVAMGDAEALSRLIASLETLAADRPLVAEVVLPLARGLEAFGQGGYEDAIDWLEPLDGQLVRVGGSHAQWEVFEDTLLHAYLRAGRFGRAEALLRRRLARRSSARDVVWLEHATSAQAARPSAEGPTVAQGSHAKLS